MNDETTQHTYQIGDAVLVDLSGASVPGVIEDERDNRFQVRLARPWTDEENVSESMWLGSDALRPYESASADRALPAQAEGASEAPGDTGSGAAVDNTTAPGSMTPQLDDLQRQHDEAFRAWGKAFHEHGYGSPEEQACFSEVERLGLQIAELKAGISQS